MQKTGPFTLFRGIPEGSPDQTPTQFESVTLNDNWGNNIVFDLHGETIALPGPIHVADRSDLIGERRKIRFVEVFFFLYTRSQSYATSGPRSRLFSRAYGWQGENGLLHLLEDMWLLKDDPMANDPQERRSIGAQPATGLPMLDDPREAAAHPLMQIETHDAAYEVRQASMKRLEDSLREHGERLHQQVLEDEQKIHENLYGMDEIQDVLC